ncbi:MAG: hypothetical protein QMD61_00135 [Methanobacterium sp.]|nr:hypothetical protein [Methanobacterium sp.]
MNKKFFGVLVLLFVVSMGLTLLEPVTATKYTKIDSGSKIANNGNNKVIWNTYKANNKDLVQVNLNIKKKLGKKWVSSTMETKKLGKSGLRILLYVTTYRYYINSDDSLIHINTINNYKLTNLSAVEWYWKNINYCTTPYKGIYFY